MVMKIWKGGLIRLFKKLLSLFLILVVVGVAGIGILYATGTDLRDILSHWPEAQGLLQSVWNNTSQLAAETGSQLYSRFADYQPPQGDGRPMEGDLPEDRLPEAETGYDFPEDFYPYRAMLSAAEQSVYDQAYGNAMALYEQFPLHTPLPADSVERVMTALFCDHPELFWLDSSYQYSYTPQDHLVVSVALSFNETAADIEIYRVRFEAAAQPVLQAARNLDSVVLQEKYVHDYLLDNVSYNLNSALNQSAYSALVYGESVCAGYSRAFQYLMRQLGVPCYYCTGTAGGPHAWNIIRLDENYYHVDVAWDDPLGNESGQRYYNYFNLTDAQISTDHTRGDLSALLPECNSTAYSYANVFGSAQDAGGDVNTNIPVYGQTARSPEETGFSRSEAISSIDLYYSLCEEKIVELGEGTHTFAVLLADEKLMETIFRLTQDKTAMDAYLPGAARRLGFDAYSAGVSLQGEALTDGFWLLTQQITLTGQQGRETRSPSDEFPEHDESGGDTPDEIRPEENAPGGRIPREGRR